jgi:hypothetical protein
MANKKSIDKATPTILRYFDKNPQKIFKATEIKEIFTSRRVGWRLSRATMLADFLNCLADSGKLRRIDFPFPDRHEYRYIWDEVPLLAILLTLKPKSYFSHHTAAWLHGYAIEEKTIYINHEQKPHVKIKNLEQAKITAAFSRKPRQSNNKIQYGKNIICLINGMYTAEFGVIEKEIKHPNQKFAVRVTNPERTLIDIAVRPIYTNGVRGVLDTFKQAKDSISVNRLLDSLQTLDYVYPYHQAIGFYLERAGYKGEDIDKFHKLPKQFDFYLMHGMNETDYVKNWRLHVPKGF